MSKHKQDNEQRKFLAQLQGVDTNDEQETSGTTFEDIKRRAMGIEASGDDIISLQGSFATEAGFGIGCPALAAISTISAGDNQRDWPTAGAGPSSRSGSSPGAYAAMSLPFRRGPSIAMQLAVRRNATLAKINSRIIVEYCWCPSTFHRRPWQLWCSPHRLVER